MGILIIIAIIYFSIRYATNKARKENMSKIDFLKDKEYYREILMEYSPEELSYIDDFKVEALRDIVAIILKLKLIHRIEIDRNQIIVINSNTEGLKKTEKFVLQNIKDGKVKIDNAGYIESFAQDEAIEDGLIRKNTDGKKRIKNMVIKMASIGIVLFILFVALCSNIEKINQINDDKIMLILILVIGIFLFILIYGFFVAFPVITGVYSLMQRNAYSRTEKGEEVNKKIEGLKKYITDYSLLQGKGKDTLTVWEEYLIYSVIFDLNDSIVEEMSSLIEIEFEYGKIYFDRNKK